MSAVRKNSRRLRDLRAVGVRIDGDYLVTGFTLERLNVRDIPGAPDNLRARLVDHWRDLYYVPPTLQRVILKGLTS